MTTAMHEPGLMGARPRIGRLGVGLVTLLWLAALLAATAVDRQAYMHLRIKDEAGQRLIESRDWYRLLRVFGSLLTWIGVALVLMMVDRARIRAGALIKGGWPRRGVVLFVSALLSGAAAEGLKAVVGRLKPHVTDGSYAFMPLAERLQWNWSELGMPSSHAAVAFGAAMALSFKYRAAAPVFLLAAVGCGLTRVAVGQHFVSDVLVAAWVAYAVSRAVWRVDAWNNGGIGLGHPGTGVDGDLWAVRPPRVDDGRGARGGAAP